MANMHTALPSEQTAPPVPEPINIGVTIRGFRLQKGHTVPSLETLQKIAGALDISLSHFFSEDPVRDVSGISLSEEEIRFLTQVQRYAANLTERDRRLLLAMVRKFAATVSTTFD